MTELEWMDRVNDYATNLRDESVNLTAEIRLKYRQLDEKNEHILCQSQTAQPIQKTSGLDYTKPCVLNPLTAIDDCDLVSDQN